MIRLFLALLITVIIFLSVALYLIVFVDKPTVKKRVNVFSFKMLTFYLLIIFCVGIAIVHITKDKEIKENKAFDDNKYFDTIVERNKEIEADSELSLKGLKKSDGTIHE